MTDAPNTIWAARGTYDDIAGLRHPPAIQYTLTTHSDALVAAAHEDAATLFDPKISEANHQEFSLPHVYEGDQAAIRQRTPANAQAAYDAAIAQARREGWEAAQKEAVALCVDASKKAKIWRDAAQKDCAELEPYHDGEFQQSKRLAFDIQALEYKEPSND